MSAKKGYSGVVQAVVFENPQKDFYILRMVLDEMPPNVPAKALQRSSVVVKGSVSGLRVEIGTWIPFLANWVEHPKYGPQLRITQAPYYQGDIDNPEVMCRMLTTAGVGKPICDLLESSFGEDLGKALKDKEMLGGVLPPIQAEYVWDRWKSVRAYYLTLGFLVDLGIPSAVTNKIWEHFGEESRKILNENPWALSEIEGITMAHMDAVASRIGLSLTSEDRISGAVLHSLRTARNSGDLYMEWGRLLVAIKEHIRYASDIDITHCIGRLVQEGKIVGERNGGRVALYEPWLHRLEDEAAKMIADRMLTAFDHSDEYLDSLISIDEDIGTVRDEGLEAVIKATVRVSMGGALNLSDLQRQGLFNALYHPVSVLTGLPGTGKTTSLRILVKILQQARISFLLLAPTGIAAKRMSAVTNAPAHTVHRAFKAQGGASSKQREAGYEGVTDTSGRAVLTDTTGEDWGYDTEPHPARVVIVDESSMVDQHLMYRILRSTRADCRLIFVGDAQQLPSVGPGDVLREMTRSGEIPTVALTEIFRQEDTSDIVRASHAINSGRSPRFGGDFALEVCKGDEAIVEAVVRIAADLKDQGCEFQVLCPRHKKTVGVTHLNSVLREHLNPKDEYHKKEVKIANWVLREGDRIMVRKNDYNLEVFNGDVGKIRSIDSKKRRLKVKIYGEVSKYIFVDFSEVFRLLGLAYCVTVHKSQGLEYDYIVMPMIEGFGPQLQRNLLYTAVTRAKKKVILVGSGDAITTAVINDSQDNRNTLFAERIQRGVRKQEEQVA